ncbi:MAG: sensor domain-containing diguanylate cyclase [Candidatus Wallbacteria bacterium]|nr:sensor domain-containing diguanylate cyclase [Candidatus Wallbacteria bacterium]
MTLSAVITELVSAAAAGGGGEEFAAALERASALGYLGFFTSQEPAGFRPFLTSGARERLGEDGSAALSRSLSETLADLGVEGSAASPPRGEALPIELPQHSVSALCYPVWEGEAVVGGVVASVESEWVSMAPLVDCLRVLLSRGALEAQMRAHERALVFLNDIYRSNIERQEAEAALGVEITLSKLADLFHFDAAALALPESEGWIMLHWLSTDCPPHFADEVRQQTLMALERDQGAVPSSVRHVMLWQHRPPPSAQTPESYFIHTLQFDRQGKRPGMLGLYSAAPDILTTDEMRLLVLLTPGLAIAFRNSQLLFALERQAKIDEMTGLYNYRTFRALLGREFTRLERYGEPLSLLLLDIDYFKKVNDTYGHQTGDAVLRALASLLLDTKRGVDAVARYGGEEFVMILPDTDLDGAALLAERVRKQVAAQPILPDRSVTVSIGVASFTASDRGPEDELIHRADMALYRAKQSGRNRVELARQ